MKDRGIALQGLVSMTCIVAWVALALTMGVAVAEDAPPAVDPARCSYLPEGLLDRVVYYHGFSRGVRYPEVNRIEATHRFQGNAGKVVEGFSGRAMQMPPEGKGGSLLVQSKALSPARSMTLSMWYRVDADTNEKQNAYLINLTGPGRRHISTYICKRMNFHRSQTPPCYAVLVRNFPGLRDYYRASGTVRYRKGTWHHVALVFGGARRVQVYWDGRLRGDWTNKVRPFTDDEGGTVRFGRAGYEDFPMTLDDIMVLDVAMTARQIARYIEACRALHEVNFPAVVATP